ncbi:hypothetical protein ACWKSP_20935 [Micromonosporaceae bacterium Da 78-11]
MHSRTPPLPERWRIAYNAALALISTDRPFDDPTDLAARARAQRARTDTRRWIAAQKRLAKAGELSVVQALFIAQIPESWREIDLRRRRAGWAPADRPER